MTGRVAILGDQLEAIIRSADRDELLSLLVVVEGHRAVIRERLRVDGAARPAGDRALTASAAARRLKVHEDTARSLCKAGRLRFFRVGKREIRISESAVIEFLRGGHAETTRAR